MMGMLGFAALACSCVSLVFSIISTALPYWYYIERSSEGFTDKTYTGLWSSCRAVTYVGQTKSVCVSIESDEAADFLKATRALEIIGLLLSATAGVVGFLKLVVMKKQAVFPIIGGGLAIAAGVCMLLGAIIYGAKAKDALLVTGSTLHAGFALAIVSGVISFVAGGLFFASKSS